MTYTELYTMVKSAGLFDWFSSEPPAVPTKKRKHLTIPKLRYPSTLEVIGNNPGTFIKDIVTNIKSGKQLYNQMTGKIPVQLNTKDIKRPDWVSQTEDPVDGTVYWHAPNPYLSR